jgi:hypothetical protein
MSFNPTRLAKGQLKQQRRIIPNSGIKRSQLMKIEGPQFIKFSEWNKKQEITGGWKIPYFNGNFECFYQLICARNSTGKVVNKKKDKFIKVLNGLIYILIEDKTIELVAGNQIGLEKNQSYTLATSGSSDVELLVCQDKDYDKTTEILEQTDKLNNMPKGMELKESISIERRGNEKAKQQAEMIASQKTQRDVVRNQRRVNQPIGLPGQNVQGVNPRPIIPTED